MSLLWFYYFKMLWTQINSLCLAFSFLSFSFFFYGMGAGCSVINALDSSMSPPQFLYMPLLSLLDGDVPSQSHAPHWITPDTLLQCPQIAKLYQAGSREKEVMAEWLFLFVQGRTAPIDLPAVCFPSLKAFHPLYRDADGLSLAMFSCFASNTSRNPGRRWTT